MAFSHERQDALEAGIRAEIGGGEYFFAAAFGLLLTHAIALVDANPDDLQRSGMRLRQLIAKGRSIRETQRASPEPQPGTPATRVECR